MNEMKPTAMSSLLWAAVIAALIAWMTAFGFYGSFPPLSVMGSVLLFLMAVGCGIAGKIVRKKISEGEIGHDRSQMSPITVAQLMITGQAVAWIGAVIGGAYTGIGVHVMLHAGELTAAQQDVPGVIVGALGGLAAAVAGAWLERSCVAPPMDPPGELAAG